MLSVALVALEIVLQAPSAAVVGVGPAPLPAETRAKQANILQTQGFTVLEDNVARRILLPPNTTPETPDYESLVEDARRKEAEFKTEEAMALRNELLAIFTRTLRPGPQLREAVARALHDGVGGYLAENQKDKAETWARRALRHFPDTSVDMTRHPPAVLALIDEAREFLQAEAKGRLTVESNVPGKVYLNGAMLGDMRGKLQRSVPYGTYRLWVETENGMSLPHSVRLSKEEPEATLVVDARLEAALILSPQVALRCESQCASLLTLLARTLGVDRVVGIYDDGRTSTANAADEVQSEPIALSTSTIAAPRPRFSPLYLVPFGVGQFAQKRPAWGTTYLTAGAGLLAWHIAAVLKHQDAAAADESKLRTQRNVSAGLLLGVGVASVVEAIIVGARTGQ